MDPTETTNTPFWSGFIGNQQTQETEQLRSSPSNNRPPGHRGEYRGHGPQPQPADGRRNTAPREHWQTSSYPPSMSHSVDATKGPTHPKNENGEHHGSYSNYTPSRGNSISNDEPSSHARHDSDYSWGIQGHSRYSRDPLSNLTFAAHVTKRPTSEKSTRSSKTLHGKDKIIADLKEQLAKLRMEDSDTEEMVRQGTEKLATEELVRFNAVLHAKDDMIADLKKQRTALRQGAEKSAAEELARFDAALCAKDDVIAEFQQITERLTAELVRVNTVLRERDDTIVELRALHQTHKKSAAEELVRFNAAVRARDTIIVNLKEQMATLQQDMAKSAAEELVQFNATLRAKDDIIAELKEQKVPLRQIRLLTQNDSRLATHVKELIEALNYEIQQVAAAVAKCLRENADGVGRPVFDEDRSSAFDLVKRTVGERLSRGLGAWNHKKDLTLLQLAFQAALCQYCKRFVELWDEGAFTDLSGHLTNIYQTMRTTEPQLVLAQWRALTQLQVNAILDREHPESRFAPSVMRDILRVAVVSNIHHPDLHSLLTPVLSKKLQIIEGYVRRIKKAVTLEIISGDFELIFVHPGKTFDESYMIGASAPNQDASRTRVACTTKLGLRLAKKVLKGEETVYKSLNLLAAQVLLESSVDDLL